MKLRLKKVVEQLDDGSEICITNEEFELSDESMQDLCDCIFKMIEDHPFSDPGRGTYTIEKFDGLLKFKNRGWAISNDLGLRLKFEEDE